MVKNRNLLVAILSVVFAFALISFVAANPVSADSAQVATVTTETTATVRLDDDGMNGIRFTGYVSRDVELSRPTDGEFLASDTYVGIIIGKGELQASELTIDGDVLNVPAVNFDGSKSTDDVKAFNAVVWDIPEQAYAQVLTARAYLYDNGTYTYANEVCSRSFVQVASAEWAKDQLSVEMAQTVIGYIDAVKPTVKIGDTVLTKDGENKLDASIGDVINVTTIPAGISAIVSPRNDATALSSSGNAINVKGFSYSEQVVYIDIGSDFYEVTIGVEEWKDENLDENTVADFNEEYYKYTIETTAGQVTWLDATKAQEEIGADSGVVKIDATVDYVPITVRFQKPIKKADMNGFYIKFRYPELSAGHMYLRFPKANGSYMEGNQYGERFKFDQTEYVYKPNELHTMSFNNKDIFGNANAVAGAGYWTEVADTVTSIQFYLTWACKGAWYFDEIGVKPTGDVTGTELINFNTADDYKNYVYNRFWPSETTKVVVPEDADYPKIDGATTGMLTFTSDSHGTPGHIYMEKGVKGSSVAKLVFRIYAPAVNGVDTAAFRINVTQKDINKNSNQFEVTTSAQQQLEFERGKLVDVEVDMVNGVTGTLSDAYINVISLFICNPPAGEGMWYLDSISYVLK